jgi:hypothetical protein
MCVFLAFFCNSARLANAKRVPHQKTEFGVGALAGGGLRRFHGTCMGFRLFFISGEFFDKFVERETLNGTKFIGHGDVLSKFPEHVIVDVHVNTFRCSPRPDEIETPGYGEGLLSDPSFDASWKNGSPDSRPVVLFSIKQKLRIPSLQWDYFLDISSKDTPLTDALLIDISLRKGTIRVQLCASLVPVQTKCIADTKATAK